MKCVRRVSGPHARLQLALEPLEDRLLLSFTGPGLPELISISAPGVQSSGPVGNLALSDSGRYVAYDSIASDLVDGDTNGVSDVFLYDRLTGAVSRISVSDLGDQADGGSWVSALSADGRFVTFHSDATNLVPGDTNGRSDVFVYDRVTGAVERVSVTSTGEQARGSSYSSDISADGRYVAYYSYASNLSEGDANGQLDVFVYDRDTGIVERVSVSSSGETGNSFSQDPVISADGRYVAFHSKASNLVEGDTNDTRDVFVYDRETDTIRRISTSSDGGQADAWSAYASLSDDGRYVAFHSKAGNLVEGDANGERDVFVYDMQTGAVELISGSMAGGSGNGWSSGASISADGRYVAFHSEASDLVAGDTNACRDVFVYDRATGAMERVSQSGAGEQGARYSESASISADGRYVAFASAAENLVADDTNGQADAFVYDRLACAELEAVSASGPAGPIGVNSSGTVNVEVANNGIKDAGGFSIALYLSADATLDASDLMVGTATVAGVAAESAWAGDIAYDLAAVTGEQAGQYYWIARVDALGQVVETNEADNIAVSSAVEIAGPRYIGSIRGRGGAAVAVYDMDISGPVDCSLDDVAVVFNRDGSIKSITLQGKDPMSGLGLFITGTSYVEQIKDARGSGRADIALIASEAAIGQLHVKTNVTGSVVGGLTLGGISFAQDVDGDGILNDPLSLYCTGAIGQTNVQGEILGDVVVGSSSSSSRSSLLTATPLRAKSLRRAGRLARSARR
jgi:Tol biopolymer transport system component